MFSLMAKKARDAIAPTTTRPPIRNFSFLLPMSPVLPGSSVRPREVARPPRSIQSIQETFQAYPGQNRVGDLLREQAVGAFYQNLCGLEAPPGLHRAPHHRLLMCPETFGEGSGVAHFERLSALTFEHEASPAAFLHDAVGYHATTDTDVRGRATGIGFLDGAIEIAAHGDEERQPHRGRHPRDDRSSDLQGP